MITPERLSAWRIFPRLLITLYGVAFWRTTEWFMQLPDPTNSQAILGMKFIFEYLFTKRI